MLTVFLHLLVEENQTINLSQCCSQAGCSIAIHYTYFMSKRNNMQTNRTANMHIRCAD